jgi:hypothetical protein
MDTGERDLDLMEFHNWKESCRPTLFSERNDIQPRDQLEVPYILRHHRKSERERRSADQQIRKKG